MRRVVPQSLVTTVNTTLQYCKYNTDKSGHSSSNTDTAVGCLYHIQGGSRMSCEPGFLCLSTAAKNVSLAVSVIAVLKALVIVSSPLHRLPELSEWQICLLS